MRVLEPLARRDPPVLDVLRRGCPDARAHAATTGYGFTRAVRGIMVDLYSIDPRHLQPLTEKSRGGHRGEAPSCPFWVEPVTDLQTPRANSSHETTTTNHRTT
jgi:hypothetical protein